MNTSQICLMRLMAVIILSPFCPVRPLAAMNESEIASFLQKLESAPSWTSLRRGNVEAGRRRLNALGSDFRKFSPADAREIVRRFQLESNAKNAAGEPEDSLSKVYLLLRFYFSVPGNEKVANASFYGGWVGVPTSETEVNLLWPLHIRNGTPAVASDFEGYQGEPYDALGEFDFFSTRYAPRGVVGK